MLTTRLRGDSRQYQILKLMASVADQVLSFLQERDRDEGWTSTELCEQLGVQAKEVSRTYRLNMGKLIRWGGKEGPDSKAAEQAAALASKLSANDPKQSGGQPYRYRYNLDREGLAQASLRSRAKSRENTSAHKSVPHIVRRQELAQQPPDDPDWSPKKRRLTTTSDMDSIACTACRSRDGEDSMVLCDGCDDAWHIKCMLPKRDKVPSGDWFCDLCLAAAASRRPGLDAVQPERQTKVRAPWKSSLIGQAVYLCLEEGWRSGVITKCLCNAASTDELNLAAGSKTVHSHLDASMSVDSTSTADAETRDSSAKAVQIPTAEVEYEVQLDGHSKATRPIEARTIRVSWLWLRQGCTRLASYEAERLVGCNVRKRFTGHGVFKGIVRKLKFVLQEPPGPDDGSSHAAPVVRCATADGATRDIWFNICYEDGDKEDVAFHELTGMMVDARVEDAKEDDPLTAAVAPGEPAAGLVQHESNVGGESQSLEEPALAQQPVQEQQYKEDASGRVPAGAAEISAKPSDPVSEDSDSNDDGASVRDNKAPSHRALARPVFPGLQASSSLGIGALQEEEETMQLYLLQSKSLVEAVFLLPCEGLVPVWRLEAEPTSQCLTVQMIVCAWLRLAQASGGT